MKNNRIIGLFIVIFVIIQNVSCNINNNTQNHSIENKNEINTKIKDIPDTLFYCDKDTFALYYNLSSTEIKIKVFKNAHNLFDKILNIKDIIGDVDYIAQAYFNSLFLTDFDKESQQFIFTTYIKKKKQ
ncbi:MAG: hypothetical protein NTZ33_15430 [Bacteroidetes bacterium]|nr:hypothetical protein [Bacteroidota bacterium]